MTDAAADWRVSADELANYLRDLGVLRDPAWAEVFATAPRHEFVFSDAALSDEDGNVREPAGWSRAELLRAAYADQVVVTRWETVAAGDAGVERRVATSSASQPAIVALMLELLEVSEGCRVLEIGTGPGYNAYLLCRRLGDDNVASLDVQADVVDEAAERLKRLGFRPYLSVRDGAEGCPERAPFDRVLVTCALSRVPQAWLEQLAPGARIVAPMNFGGAIAVLDREADGVVSGHFDSECGFFMAMRHDGEEIVAPPPTSEVPGEPHTHGTAMDVAALGDLDFRLWLELFLPGLALRPTRDGDGEVSSVRLGHGARHAEVSVAERDAGTVVEHGDGLWPVVEHAYDMWTFHDRPARSRLGMTVAPRRQWAWLDRPDSGVEWEL
ncbi:MAG: methyltransferase domain-containing protein [Stackebrandtia sp.]